MSRFNIAPLINNKTFMAHLESYKDLIVWQKSLKLAEEVYKLTENFPSSEKFGLTSQMRRAVVSIPSNIAEGSRRGTLKNYRNFLLFAFSSGSELETQIEICKKLNLVDNLKYELVDSLLLEVMKMLNTLVRRLAR